jgi:glutaredoxin
MPEPAKSRAKQATEKLFAALNRADELGGELRDYLQDKVATDPRYVQARKRLARLLGRSYQSRDEAAAAVRRSQAKKAAAAATPLTSSATRAASGSLGDPAIKAQIFGKKSCPWTGRAITVLERNKVDFDVIDLEEPEHEAKQVRLANDTKQHTVPYVFLRGQFIGGYNALAEIERLGQLESALMTPEERAKLPAHARFEIVARPNTDEDVPAEHVRPES